MSSGFKAEGVAEIDGCGVWGDLPSATISAVISDVVEAVITVTVCPPAAKERIKSPRNATTESGLEPKRTRDNDFGSSVISVGNQVKSELR